MIKLLMSFIGILILSNQALADYSETMGGQGMMWRGHTGGCSFLFFGFFGLLYVTGFVLFFWLLFRITWALEAIARAKS